MARLRIAPIVEGDGEVACLPTLLRRVWKEIVGGEYADVLRPNLKPRDHLIDEKRLRDIVEETAIMLASRSTQPLPGLILILIDADTDCPAEIGPRLHHWAQGVDARFSVSCVLANMEYETWFAASARSLVERGYLKLKPNEAIPDNPEGQRLRKKWIQDRYAVQGEIKRNVRYSPTVDQLAMTREMDLSACRANSPSFDKLCRELEKRIKLVGLGAQVP